MLDPDWRDEVRAKQAEERAPAEHTSGFAVDDVTTLSDGETAARLAIALAALDEISHMSTNHGGWFDQDPFGEYVKLGTIAHKAWMIASGKEPTPPKDIEHG